MAAGIGIAKKIPGFGAIVSVVDVRRWVSLLRRIGVDRLTAGYLAEARALKDLMLETGFRKWAKFWHYGRTQISLQMRLFSEQVYSDLGDPWSSMITGFGPMTKKVISPKVLEKERRLRAIQKSNALKRAKERRKRNA